MYIRGQMSLIHPYMKRVSALFTLVVYVAVSIPFFHVHEKTHQHHEKHAGTFLENDACHNYIYHGISSKQEHNHDHALELNLNCFTCQFFKSNPVAFVFSTSISDFTISDNVQPRTGLYRKPQSAAFHFTSRGPPIVA